jgi:YaiO family outer membrane protein
MKISGSIHFSINHTVAFICVCFLGFQLSPAQQINTDSLLIKAYESLKEKKYELAFKQAHLGKKISPDYLDFQLLIGRIHQITSQQDSARLYFKKVLAKNTAYEEAFLYLINLELKTENYEPAEILINDAITIHPKNQTFPLKKLRVYQLKEDVNKEREYLEELTLMYPKNDTLTQRLFWLNSRFNSNRIGVQYRITNFDRSGVGPWHLGTIQYIGERPWGSFLGRVNYTQRRSNDSFLIDGVQLEGKSYFFTGDKSYANVSIGYSEDLVFPKWRLGATYFQALPMGWEMDLGMRYTYVVQNDIPAATLGVGKYFGSYWMHFRSFFQQQKKNIYPAFTLTSRYYYHTRFDYINSILGYGTSPDERILLGDLNQRIELDSYRVGLGYYRQFGKHFLIGVQGVYNYQEYSKDKWQNEYETFIMIHCRL